jgi:hypothetical protein
MRAEMIMIGMSKVQEKQLEEQLFMPAQGT